MEIKMEAKTERISTGYIAQNINSLHKPGVLQEMKRLYLQEIEKFFIKNDKGEKILREDVCLTVPCPICNSKKDKARFIVKVNGFDHLRCTVCQNIYVSPRLKDEFIWEQYSRPSYTYMFKNLIEDTLTFRKEVIAYGKFKWVTKRLPDKNSKSLLDIGSGLGENLAIYKDNGWEVAGIEFNEYAAQKSRELFGVTVFNTPIEQAKLPRDLFDVITLWGVLEHLTEPVKVSKEILKHLSPNGVFVFMVPQFNCLLSSYLQDNPQDADRLLDGDKHITVFTKEGIEYFADSLDLRVVDMVSRGLDFTSILDYLDDEKETRLYKLVKKELPALQRGIEEAGFGDGLWAMLAKK